MEIYGIIFAYVIIFIVRYVTLSASVLKKDEQRIDEYPGVLAVYVALCVITFIGCLMFAINYTLNFWAIVGLAAGSYVVQSVLCDVYLRSRKR